MKNGECIFSPCRRWRYTLWRVWDFLEPEEFPFLQPRYSGQYLQVIGLNPSTADETQDDPTIRRCIDFAKRWGYSALCMTNLFAWRDTLPENMKKARDPIGPENNTHLLNIAAGAGLVLAAWGEHGSHLGRAAAIAGTLNNLHCLGVNKDGSPKHPLYQPKNARTIPWPPR